MKSKVTEATENYFSRKISNYILGKRLCRDCAEQDWIDEDREQRVNTFVGICEKCHNGTLVAYIDK